MERDPAALEPRCAAPGLSGREAVSPGLWRRAWLVVAPPQWSLRVCVLLVQLAGRLTTL